MSPRSGSSYDVFVGIFWASLVVGYVAAGMIALVGVAICMPFVFLLEWKEKFFPSITEDFHDQKDHH